MKRALAMLAALALAVGAGCTGSLPVPQIVLTPRVLIVVADEPETVPGRDIGVRVLAYDPEGRPLTYVWRTCLSIGSILRANNLQGGSGGGTCDAIPDATGDSVIIPGERTAALLEQFQGVPAGEGRDTIDFLMATTGLGFRVEVDVMVEGVVVARGYKTIGLVADVAPGEGIPPRAELTTNPPPIDYLFGDTYVSMPREGITGSGFDCVIWGEPIVLPPDTQIEIAPPADAEPAWIETYPVLDYMGRLAEGREGAYYSFHATGGTLQAETTNPPLQNLYYTTPLEPGPVRFWLEVRDGHLGARACTFELTVAPPG